MKYVCYRKLYVSIILWLRPPILGAHTVEEMVAQTARRAAASGVLRLRCGGSLITHIRIYSHILFTGCTHLVRG